MTSTPTIGVTAGTPVAEGPAPMGRLARVLGRDEGTTLLYRVIFEERRRFWATVALMLVGAALEGVGIGLLIPFLENLLNPTAPPLQTGWRLFDTAVLAVDKPLLTRLYWIAGVILISVWLRAAVSYAGFTQSVRMTESILDRLRRRMMDQIQLVSVRFFSTARSGEILNTLTTELTRLQSLFSIARMFLVTGLMILTYGVAIVAISWQLAGLTLVLSLFLFAVLSGSLGKLRKNGQVIAESRARLAALAGEQIGGIRTINEFGAQRFEARRFAAVSEEARRENVTAFARSALVGPLSQGIAATTLIVLVVVAVQVLILPGQMSTAALFAFLVVLLRLLPLLQSINTSRAEWAVYRGALDQVAALLRTSDKPYLRDGTEPLTGFHDTISVEHVSFAYEKDETVLDRVSLDVRRGEVTAIVGASGSGKSTLVDLVARFYDPDQGRILVDGVDLRRFRLADLRERVAVVNQHTFLFNDTVRHNIAYGLDNVDEDALREAASEANALEFIDKLPLGFDTVLGERGARLSGGQRQRIAIARALLRDPDLLILDEATSALDSVSEKLVQESMERLMEGRTVIVIAHRLSTVEGADQVVVLEDGRIVEQGSYEELLAREGQLWRYHQLQYQLA